MKCNNCGNICPDNAKFCHHCGKELTAANRCPKCGYTNAPSSNFCQSCGAPLRNSRPTTVRTAQSNKATSAKTVIFGIILLIATLMFLYCFINLFAYTDTVNSNHLFNQTSTTYVFKDFPFEIFYEYRYSYSDAKSDYFSTVIIWCLISALVTAGSLVGLILNLKKRNR